VRLRLLRIKGGCQGNSFCPTHSGGVGCVLSVCR
jgi:hypothetical protein